METMLASSEPSKVQPSPASILHLRLFSHASSPSFRVSVLVVTQKRRSAANTTGRDSFALNPSPKYLSQLHVATRTLKQRCPEVETDVYIGQGSTEHHRAKLRTDHHHRPPTPVNVAVAHVLLNERLPPWGCSTGHASFAAPSSERLSPLVCACGLYFFLFRGWMLLFSAISTPCHMLSLNATAFLGRSRCPFGCWDSLLGVNWYTQHID